MISKYAKSNYIDHRMTDQSSIIRFIEDNWNLARLGGDSTDVKAGSLFGMFDFEHHADRLMLDTGTGEPRAMATVRLRVRRLALRRV